MTITIKFFALGRELVGANALTLDLSDGTTIEGALAHVRAQHPTFAQLPSFLVALNTEYAEQSTMLKNGDELAIIPPVSGG